MKVWITKSQSFITFVGPYRIYEVKPIQDQMGDVVHSMEEATLWDPIKGPVKRQVTISYWGKGIEWVVTKEQAFAYVEKLRQEQILLLQRHLAEIETLPVICGSRLHESG